MSREVTRYDPTTERNGTPYLRERPDGPWVRWDDYAALAARVAELEGALRDAQMAVNKGTKHVCDSMETWEREIRDQHWSDPNWKGRIEAIRATFLMIHKSSFLDRLIYGCEPLRTVPCPEHKGKWSGIGDGCKHGCGQTGWLPAALEPNP